jgi:hypothetical protein
MDYLDDLHNVFTHAYKVSWRRNGDGVDQARELARVPFNWDKQTSRCQNTAILSLLEVAVGQEMGRTDLLDFFKHVRCVSFLHLVLSYSHPLEKFVSYSLLLLTSILLSISCKVLFLQ